MLDNIDTGSYPLSGTNSASGRIFGFAGNDGLSNNGCANGEDGEDPREKQHVGNSDGGALEGSNASIVDSRSISFDNLSIARVEAKVSASPLCSARKQLANCNFVRNAPLTAGKRAIYPDAIEDVCHDCDVLIESIEHFIDDITFILIKNSSGGMSDSGTRRKETWRTRKIWDSMWEHPKWFKKRKLGSSGSLGKTHFWHFASLSRSSTSLRNMNKAEQELPNLLRELQRAVSELFNIRQWFITSDPHGKFADHVAIVFSFIELLVCEDLGSDGEKGNESKSETSLSQSSLRSPKRICGEVYKARYDGITLPLLALRLQRKGMSWTAKGNLALLSLRLRGFNEVLEMIYTGNSVPADNVAICIATGQHTFVENWSHCEVVDELYDVKRVAKQTDRFINHLMIINASMDSMRAKQSLAKRVYALASNGIYFGILHRRRGVHQGEVCYTGCKDNMMEKVLPFAKFVWNLPDKPLIKQLYRATLPWIRTSFAFTIRTDDVDGDGNGLLKARFICNNFLQCLPSDKDFGSKPEPKTRVRCIILHFHGGGFIAQSAAAHEGYTRMWARDLKCPIVSVDYSLAPEHCFPIAANEAIAAYKWCVEVAGQVYGTNKVIVTGDSAGGTLCAVIAIACAQQNYAVPPHGALLAYPALDFMPAFTPSIAWTINDKMIPYLILQCCLSAYLGTTDSKEQRCICENPLANPSVVSDELLAKFPRCHFVVATRDPLFDHTIAFAERMDKLVPSGVMKLTIVPEMIHGFLSLNLPVIGVSKMRKLIKLCGRYINDLIEQEPASNTDNDATSTITK